MQMANVTSVPAITCAKVCFFNSTLVQAIKGRKIKRRYVYGEGKRYTSVQKRKVEYVICPLIFQENVIAVITDDTTKRQRATFVSCSKPNCFTTINIIPKSRERVMKYRGLSSLFVKS